MQVTSLTSGKGRDVTHASICGESVVMQTTKAGGNGEKEWRLG